MKYLLSLAALSLLSSCSGLSVSNAYLEADKMTYEAIAPDYRTYVEDDANLDEAAKAARIRLLNSWKMRLEANKK